MNHQTASNYSPIFKRDISDQFPIIKDDDSPLARKYNQTQREYWERAGNYRAPDELLIEILFADYNERHKEQDEKS